jgi:hypothetical protein
MRKQGAILAVNMPGMDPVNGKKTKNSLDNQGLSPYYDTRAEVVELVDALRSGRSGSNPVGVRVPPSAPYY